MFSLFVFISHIQVCTKSSVPSVSARATWSKKKKERKKERKEENSVTLKQCQNTVSQKQGNVLLRYLQKDPYLLKN